MVPDILGNNGTIFLSGTQPWLKVNPGAAVPLGHIREFSSEHQVGYQGRKEVHCKNEWISRGIERRL